MAIRRPNYIIVKKGKKGLKAVYESEHRHLAQQYQIDHGGEMIVSETLDDDGLIVPSQDQPVIEDYVTHSGPVPEPSNAIPPYGLAYGLGMESVRISTEEDGERTVHLPERLLRDVLSALEDADKE